LSKGAKSRTRGRKSRSTVTKTCVGRAREPRPQPEEKLRARARELENELDASNRELKEARQHLAEALEQQTATSEVLRVISNSPTEIQPVLDAVGENAARLCDANNAVIFRLEGELLRQVASYGGLPTTSHPAGGLPVNRGRVTGRAVFERRTIHVHDLAAEEDDFPEGSRDARRDGHRTTLATPLLREGSPIGAILIRRMEVRPFSDKQIALLETFADQAVIAIENVRLFDEVQQRTRELSESLQQQTATADVLKVISRSAFDLQTVLDTLVESAARLCRADRTAIRLAKDDLFYHVASYGHSPEHRRRMEREPLRPDHGSCRVVFCPKASGCRSSTRRPIRTPSFPTELGRGTCVRCSACRCCVKELRLAFCSCSEPSYSRSRTSRSNWPRPSPTRR
jgi:hypothetical protein